jgi:hypothetical protein
VLILAIVAKSTGIPRILFETDLVLALGWFKGVTLLKRFLKVVAKSENTPAPFRDGR